MSPSLVLFTYGEENFSIYHCLSRRHVYYISAFKVQRLAAVQKYSGKNSLVDFLHALEVKFSSSVWGDSDKRDILISHLEATAMLFFKGLPRALKRGHTLMSLEMARRNPSECLKNVKKWEGLSERRSESAPEFCYRMKDLSREIHYSLEWDFIRGSK